MTKFFFPFLYNNTGGDMKVYVELIFILNFWIDFLLLLSEKIILKKITSIKRIIISSTVGSSLSFLLLHSGNLNFLEIYKFFICLIMILISFKFNDLKTLIQDIIYFYLISIILAGFIYLVREYFAFVSFISNFIVLVLLSPIILFSYVRVANKEKNIYSKLYNVKIIYKKKSYDFTGFLDTGNKLYDQYKHRPIVLIYTKKIKLNYEEGILVPFETVSGQNIIKCFLPDKLLINGCEIKDVLIGLNEKEFNIERVNAILHSDVIGG